MTSAEDRAYNDRVWGRGNWVHCDGCKGFHHWDYHTRLRRPLRRAERVGQAVGWWLMGYPYEIWWGNWVIEVPNWAPVYRLGAYLANLRLVDHRWLADQ